MRHSTLELTGRYTRPRAVDIENAASMLPSLKPRANRPESLAATGTDGRFATLSIRPRPHRLPEFQPDAQRISEAFAHHLPTAGDVSSRDLSVPDVMAGSDFGSRWRGKAWKQGV